MRIWGPDTSRYVDNTNLCLLEFSLANKFLSISFLNDYLWYVGFCKHRYFGRFCLKADWLVISCWTQKHGREQTAPCQDKWLMIGGVVTFMSCKPISDARRSVKCLQTVLSKKKCWILFRNLVTWCHIMLCTFPLSRFTMQPQKNFINSFRQDWRKTLLRLQENEFGTIGA